MIASGFHIEIADFERDLADLRAVREPVFVVEQRVPIDEEWDELDPQCRHVLARDEAGRPIGTGRLTPTKKIGRMAVLPEWRGKGVGEAMLQALIDLARAQGIDSITLHAQVDAIGFYERFGFAAEGDEFIEAGIRHRTMRRTLEPLATRDRDARVTRASEVVAVSTMAQAQDFTQQLIDGAQRGLTIYSRDLEPLLYGTPAAMEGVKRVAVSGRGAQIRVLVHDPDAALRVSHPLIGLAQRLSSVIHLRTPVEDVDLQYPSAFALNDAGGYFFRAIASRPEGAGELEAPARHRQLAEYFDQVWERSQASAVLRRLDL